MVISGLADADGASWIDNELAASSLGDRRLVERLRRLLGHLGDAIGRRS